MKLIIDMPEDTHERITRPDRLFTDDDVNKICWAVYNGTPIPDNATNEDIINTMFDRDMAYNIRSYVKNYMLMGEWLDAPYQKGGK